MLSTNRIWSSTSGASVEALESLAASVDVELPSAYIELLAFSNGGEGPLQVSPYNFCLDSAETAVNLKIGKTYEKDFPGFFVFGGNGGGEYIALDLRGSKPW